MFVQFPESDILILPYIYGAQLYMTGTYAILHTQVVRALAYSTFCTIDFAQWAIYVIIYFIFWYINAFNLSVVTQLLSSRFG